MVRVYFVWGAKAQHFSGSVIERMLNRQDSAQIDLSEIRFLWEKLPKQAIGIFHGSVELIADHVNDE